MHQRAKIGTFLLGCLSLACAGCCCVPTTCDSNLGACGSNCGPLIGAGGLFGGAVGTMASCRGGCGEVYYDEWINERPVPDNCGFDCGGCGQCTRCQPVRNVLRQLWGRPYRVDCCAESCGSDCNGGCGSSGASSSGYGAISDGSGGGCDCGGSHSSFEHDTIHSVPQRIPSRRPPAPPEMKPEAVPTPAPEVTPSSALRLNPAMRRR